ncbi:hypothetical protein [Pseudooctadecabacter jejudonensis]|uniref:N-acetyltransferase domain-containing protein n=1 Tax=Pseudooctadecabacter jejudonensis TaxID=1391910 RepID=A0A1Y5T2K6_9RHOB|nr:hypothetical protein [Pseudooctadecabacter jejudonensis]SLN54148.1 hypothetical protein PSJ8397_02827 [Pseudooctadecabacter jejudonensis]
MRLPWQQSDLHPHALSLTEDALDRPDFAAALAADLAAFNPPPVIHRYRIVARQGQAVPVLITAGFTATRLTQIIQLPLDLHSHPALTSPLPDHINAHWFTPTERAPWDDWVTAHWRHYRATHQTNPPRIPDTGLRDIFAGPDLVAGLALRDGPQGRTRAFASLRDDQDIGWIGGAPPLIPYALSACLRRAISIGWTHATLEVDDDDHPLWALAEQLGHPPTDTFVTWQKERSGLPHTH